MIKIFKIVSIISLTLVVAACGNTNSSDAVKKQHAQNCYTANSDLDLNNLNLKKYAKGDFKVGTSYSQKGKKYNPKVDLNYVETGYASWYGPGFHGQKTANGAEYDQDDYTAAHPTLQLPSVVRVVNLENKKSVIVVVNDRGPFHTSAGGKRRIIDVSKKAAKELGIINKGVAKVRVEYLHEETEKLISYLPNQHKNKAYAMFKKAKQPQCKVAPEGIENKG